MALVDIFTLSAGECTTFFTLSSEKFMSLFVHKKENENSEHINELGVELLKRELDKNLDEDIAKSDLSVFLETVLIERGVDKNSLVRPNITHDYE